MTSLGRMTTTKSKNQPKMFVPGKPDPEAGLKPTKLDAATQKGVDATEKAHAAYVEAIEDRKDAAIKKAEAEGPAYDKHKEVLGIEPRKVVSHQDMFPPNHMADNTKDPTKK